jgi:multidrug efflux pump subunit AcrB
VARVELGGENYAIVGRYNGKPRPAWPSSWPPAPTRWTPPGREARLDELSPLPPGMKVVTRTTPRPFVRISIEEVVKTLVEAMCWCSW